MASQKTDYKTLSSELDEILGKLQSAELNVDEAVDLYERGMKIAKELEAYLQEAENKVARVKADWESRAQA